MAKKYMEVFADSAAKQYQDVATTGATITPVANRAFAAALSSRAVFIPGPGAAKGKFDIQRRKRTKRVASDTNAAAGTRFINRLNNASKLDWDSVEIVPGIKYDFLVNVEPGDAANFATDPSQFSDQFDTANSNLIISSEEDNIAMILADANVVKMSLGDQSKADLETFGELLFSTLSLVSTDISQLVDDYKHMSDVSKHVSKYAADALKAYKGTMFNVDSSRYADDIVPNFSYDNTDKGFVNKQFDKFVVDQSAEPNGEPDEKVVSIVMDDESVFDSGYANNVNEMNTKLLDEQFTGHSYWGASKVVDASRIVVITAKTPTKLVKKVNE